MIQNRVREFKLVKASALEVNARNWRTHGEDQRTYLSALLGEVGIAGALICYESERNGGKLTLIDGHLRRELGADVEWPVLILDVTDAEADLLLAAIDPIGALAGTDADAISKLVHDLTPDSMDLEALLQSIKVPDLEDDTESMPMPKERHGMTCPKCGYEFGDG